VTYPTPYTVGYHVRNPDGPDPFREAPSYTPPKGEAGIPVPVIQWEAAVSNTAGNDGRQLLGHDRTEVSVKLYVPPEFSPAPGDLIDLPSGPAGQYEVVGYPEDYTTGPFRWAAGWRLNLKRVEG